MVAARTLFINGDLDLHLKGHDLELQGHNTLFVRQLQNDSSHIHHIHTRYASWYRQEPYSLQVSLTFVFKIMTLTFKVITPC